MKIGMLTLGCRVNQYESDAIAEKLERKGYEIAPFDKGCDAYIINTCTVTAESDSKCRKAIRRAERYGAPIAVIGCFVQGARENEEELERVNYIAGNRDKGRIADEIERIINGERLDRRASLVGADYEMLEISSRKYVKAYVKIEDGCNNFCSYCYVPFVRGRVRSRNEEDIIEEVKRLKASGYRELILTGIETSAYGADTDKDEPLCALVERIQSECSIERLRFGSLNPSFFTEERLERLSSLECIMPHFHLSVQSASTEVLERMKRNYTSDDLYKAVSNIHKYFPTANLSCDMICGFPGETDEDFEESMSFIERAEILHTHVFPYSVREGTAASKMECRVSDFVKHLRAREMNAKAKEVHRKVFLKNVGKSYNVLAEFFKDGYVLGYTENFINLRIPRTRGIRKGDVIAVTVDENMDNLN